MKERALWLGLALALAAGLALTRPEPSLVVHTVAGAELGRFPLSSAGSFVLRYRNSLYGSEVEERYRVAGDRFSLVGLAAEELAVLEEYYGARARWVPGAYPYEAEPAVTVNLSSLTVVATDLGERVLVLPDGRGLELWRLVDDVDPAVVVSVES